jgi:phosphoglycolate phosphatase
MLELVDAYRDRYARVGYAENVLYEGVAGTISRLADAGYRLGVCTSKRADYAEKIVQMFGLLDYFEFVDGGDIHVRKVTQIEKLVANGIESGSAVMIGDRAVDILAATENGVAAIGVTWGFGTGSELESARPGYIVNTPIELAELLL